MTLSLSQDQVNTIHEYLAIAYHNNINIALDTCKDDCVRAYNAGTLVCDTPYNKKYFIINGVCLNVQANLKAIKSSHNEHSVMLHIIFKYYFSYKDDAANALLHTINASNFSHKQLTSHNYNNDDQDVVIETPRVKSRDANQQNIVHNRMHNKNDHHSNQDDHSLSPDSNLAESSDSTKLSGEDSTHWCIIM